MLDFHLASFLMRGLESLIKRHLIKMLSKFQVKKARQHFNEVFIQYLPYRHCCKALCNFVDSFTSEEGRERPTMSF